MTARFHGIIAYPVTPFKPNGDVDTALLAMLVDQLLESGAHAISPLGSTGESAYLSKSEWETVAEVSLKQVARRVPTIVGISDFTTQVAVQRARFAERLGADAVMVLPMSYWKLSEREIFQHYGAIANAISLPMMVYNNPATSGIDLSPAFIVRMANAIANITMVKESTGDIQRMHQLQALSDDTLPFYNGSNPLALAAFAAGANGWCTAAYHLIPNLTLALYNAIRSGDRTHAQQVFDQQLPLLQFLVRSNLPATIKAGLKLLGLDVGIPRPPLLPLEAAAVEHLEQLLNQVRTFQHVT